MLFHLTIEPAGKPVPLTVRVKAGPPASADVGLRLVIGGAGAVMGKAVAVEVDAFLVERISGKWPGIEGVRQPVVSTYAAP